MKKEKDNKPKGEMIKVDKKEKGKIKKAFAKVTDTLKKKWLINTSKTFILIAIIVGIYVGVHILLDKVVLKEFDFSPDKTYSISQGTIDKIGNIEDEVTITLINYNDTSSAKDYAEDVIHFIERYTEMNSHIKMERIDDVTTRPDIMQQYSITADSDLILVSAKNREKALSYSDMVTFDYAAYKTIDKTEEEITNAILYVISDEIPKVYFMNSHLQYEKDKFKTILDGIKSEANEVEDLDIMKNGGIPEDCRCLIITALREDINEFEKNEIIKYIENGGRLLILCEPNVSEPKISIPNFKEILEKEYALTLGDGVVIETDTSKMIGGSPTFLFQETLPNSLTNKLRMQLSFSLLGATNLKFDYDKLKDELNGDWEVMAATSDNAFVRTDFTIETPQRTDKDSETGTYPTAAIAHRKIGDKESKIAIFGDTTLAQDEVLALGPTESTYMVYLYNNKDIILDSVAYVLEKENAITIRKETNYENYTVTAQQNLIILIIIFSVPFVIIATGIGVWIFRRRKK